MPRRLSSNRDGWLRVVFGAEVDDDGVCPECGGEYAECPCPGPTMDDHEYKTDAAGVLVARPIKNPA